MGVHRHSAARDTRCPQGITVARRGFVSIVAALLLFSGMGWLVPTNVAAGQAATIVTPGAPLFADHDDFTVLEWMDEGTRVDVFYGPHNWLYEVRYHGTVGWTWSENISVDGESGGSGGSAAASSPSSSSSSRSSGGEHWVDVNRSTGQVTLYEDSEALHVFWGSLSRDPSDGYYATASGTYYVFVKNSALTYTPFAENYITHWVGFDEYRRNGFHSYTKDASGSIIPNGAALTAGCVALGPGEIEILYDFAFVGMRVEIHW